MSFLRLNRMLFKRTFQCATLTKSPCGYRCDAAFRGASPRICGSWQIRYFLRVDSTPVYHSPQVKIPELYRITFLARRTVVAMWIYVAINKLTRKSLCDKVFFSYDTVIACAMRAVCSYRCTVNCGRDRWSMNRERCSPRQL